MVVWKDDRKKGNEERKGKRNKMTERGKKERKTIWSVDKNKNGERKNRLMFAMTAQLGAGIA
jgi:hypothetical protein